LHDEWNCAGFSIDYDCEGGKIFVECEWGDNLYRPEWRVRYNWVSSADRNGVGCYKINVSFILCNGVKHGGVEYFAVLRNF
jgi:hypothetical protein